MGRFKAEAILIRRLPEVTITFWNKETIYICDEKNNTTSIFHRWFAPRGNYTAQWEPFRRKLLQYKQLNITTCFELALQHNIDYVSTGRKIKLDKKIVQYRKR